MPPKPLWHLVCCTQLKACTRFEFVMTLSPAGNRISAKYDIHGSLTSKHHRQLLMTPSHKTALRWWTMTIPVKISATCTHRKLASLALDRNPQVAYLTTNYNRVDESQLLESSSMHARAVLKRPTRPTTPLWMMPMPSSPQTIDRNNNLLAATMDLNPHNTEFPPTIRVS